MLRELHRVARLLLQFWMLLVLRLLLVIFIRVLVQRRMLLLLGMQRQAQFLSQRLLL